MRRGPDGCDGIKRGDEVVSTILFRFSVMFNST